MVSTSCVEILNADDAGTYAAGTWVDYKALPDLKNAGLRASELDFVDRCTPNIGITVFYFVSFILLCGFVMPNLVIAVILDNFESYRYVLRVSHIMTHCLPILVPEGTITSAHTSLPNCLLIHITRD